VTAATALPQATAEASFTAPEAGGAVFDEALVAEAPSLRLRRAWRRRRRRRRSRSRRKRKRRRRRRMRKRKRESIE
jgi:hypothetical protein